MSSIDQILKKESQHKPNRVHASDEDREHTLCGKMQTRYDPISDNYSNVDCLECILLLQAKGEL